MSQACYRPVFLSSEADRQYFSFEEETILAHVVFQLENLRDMVRRNVLTAHSPLIDRVVAQKLVVGRVPGADIISFVTITLAWKNPGTYFRYYVNWLYSGQLKTKTKANLTDLEACKGDPEFLTLARCCLLGQKLEDEKFCGVVRDAFVAKVTVDKLSFFTDIYIGQVVCCLYGNTASNDKLRELLVDVFARSVSKQHPGSLRHSVPAELLGDVAMALIGHRARLPSDRSVEEPPHDDGVNRKRSFTGAVEGERRVPSDFSVSPQAERVDRKRKAAEMER